MNSINTEIKRIAIESTKDVVFKVTSGVYNDLMMKFNRLENTVETLQCRNDELKAAVVDINSKLRPATQDMNLEQNGASLNIQLKTKRQQQPDLHRELSKSLFNQLEGLSRKRNSELVEENNSLIEDMFSNKNKKRRKS